MPVPLWAVALKLAPDCLLCAWALLVIWTPELRAQAYEPMLMIALFEGTMWLGSCTLVDVATRLSKPPSWWWSPIVALLALLAFPQILMAVPLIGELGFWVLAPFVWSLIERIGEIWTLPRAARLMRMRRRVLTFDRLYIGLVLGAIALVASGLNAWMNDGSMQIDWEEALLPWLFLGYFAAAGINHWRVHRAGFTLQPRSLLPWIDGGQAAELH